jgi:chromate transporter
MGWGGLPAMSGSQPAPQPESAGPPGEGARLGEVARLFLKLGSIAFGGPAAHIAMMEDEVVRRRRWLSRAEFLDYLGATNLIPGPNSTEMAIHIGHRRAGWAGLVVAGTCFILPAACLVGVIAWMYVRFGTLPAVTGLLYGVKPVVIAVVLQAIWGLGRAALRTRLVTVVGIAALVAAALGVHELLVLFGAGAVMAIAARVILAPGNGVPVVGLLMNPGDRQGPIRGITSSVAATGVVAAAAGMAAPFSLWALFGVFAKIGAVLFGSGYVLLAFVRADLVERLGWLTERQLLDAVAIGQVTPGPVFTTATFVGYVLAGAPGAAVATIGIFLPAFIFVAISGPIVPRLRRSALAGRVLDGVNVGSLALMTMVTWHLGRSALVDPLTILVAVLSALLLLRFRTNSAWLVLAGAGVGLLASLGQRTP